MERAGEAASYASWKPPHGVRAAGERESAPKNEGRHADAQGRQTALPPAETARQHGALRRREPKLYEDCCAETDAPPGLEAAAAATAEDVAEIDKGDRAAPN